MKLRLYIYVIEPKDFAVRSTLSSNPSS